jgi:hypothetical protein
MLKKIGYSEWQKSSETLHCFWKRNVPIEAISDLKGFIKLSYDETPKGSFPEEGVYYRGFVSNEISTNLSVIECLYPCEEFLNGWLPSAFIKIANIWLKEEFPNIKEGEDDWRDHKMYLAAKVPKILRGLITTRIQVPNVNFINKKKMWVYHHMNPVEILYVKYINENGGPKLRIPKRARFPNAPQEWQDPWADGLDCKGEPEWVNFPVRTGEKNIYLDKLGRSKGTAKEVGFRAIHEKANKIK